MIEIEDLKKVKLDKDDILVFQLKDSHFHHRNMREALVRHVRQIVKQDFLVLPESVKVGVINGNVTGKDLTIDNDTEVKPVLFDPDNLNRE